MQNHGLGIHAVIKFEQIELPKTLKHPKIPQSVQNIFKKTLIGCP